MVNGSKNRYAKTCRRALALGALVSVGGWGYAASSSGEVSPIASTGKPTAVPLVIQGGEGGQDTVAAREALQRWLTEHGCFVTVRVSDAAAVASATDFSGWRFEVTETAPANARLRAKTRDDLPLTVTWLVSAASNTGDLTSLEGERLALLNANSVLGWKVPLDLLRQANIKIDPARIYHTHAYEGAVALLLHHDVFATAIPRPLAQGWAHANDLAMVGESAPYWAGLSSGGGELQACVSAWQELQREGRNDARFGLFPSWLVGFEPLSSP